MKYLYQLGIHCHLFLAVFPLACVSHASDETLLASVVAVQSEREQLYQNGHFVWSVRTVFDGEVEEKRYEYWASEEGFKRLDSVEMNGGEPKEEITRELLWPEAYAVITAQSPEDPGVITYFGSNAEGARNIGRSELFAMANRCGSNQVQDWIKQSQEKDSEVLNLEVTRNDSEALAISFVRQMHEGVKEYQVTMTPNDYRVISWEITFRGDGNEVLSQKGSTLYSEDHNEIPVKTSDVFQGGTYDCNLLDFDLSPASEDFFFLDAFKIPGKSNGHWARRIALFGVGVVLLATYFHRKRKGLGSAEALPS